MNSLSVALRAGYLSVRTAEGASEKQSSLKAHLRKGLTYLLTSDVKPKHRKTVRYFCDLSQYLIGFVYIKDRCGEVYFNK